MTVRTLRLAAVAALALVVCRFCGPAVAGPEIRISDHVFLVQDDKAKATTFYLVVHAGCDDEEHANCLGISHYLEHLLFLGRNPDHKVIAASFFPDATANGWTTHDSTSYFQRFPLRPGGQAADLEKLFRFYAERLQGFEVGDADAERERGIVLQENRMRIGRNPLARLYSAVIRRLLPNDPRGQDVAGTPEIIAGYTVAAARAFHQRWYTRSNAVIVIHGPVDEATVRQLAEKYIDVLPEKKLPDRSWRESLRSFEPADDVIRRADPDVTQPTVLVEKLVRFEENDRKRLNAARNLLNTFLRSEFDGSPYDALVEKADLTTAVGGMSLSRIGPGGLQLTFYADPQEGVDPERLRQAVAKYWQDLASAGGIPASVVNRLKTRSAEQRMLSEKDLPKVADGLVSWFGNGGSYTDFCEMPADTAAVTPQDLQVLIEAVAGSGRQVTGILSPAGDEASPVAAAQPAPAAAALAPLSSDVPR